MCHVRLVCVDLTALDIAAVPAENLRVPRAEFAALWLAAERRQGGQARRKIIAWYGTGVVVTCRWLAAAAVRSPQGRQRPARWPMTGRTARATPELIEIECLTAGLLDTQRPVPAWLADHPGWSAGVVATLNWAWWRVGEPPFEST